MTLPQLAAFLDQLKRPIEEAPRDGTSVLGISDKGFDFVWWADNQWRSDTMASHPVTHFLPLPTKGPVEFEVVPVGRSERAYLSGLETGAEVARRLEGEE